MEVIDGIRAPDGLVPIFVAPHSASSQLMRYVLEVEVTHTMVNPHASQRYGSMLIDAEYLVKQDLQTSEPMYRDMWKKL